LNERSTLLATRGRRCLSVSQQPANDWQAQPATGTKARISVPQVVQAHADQTSSFGDRVPGTLEIMARVFWVVSRHHIGSGSLQLIQNRKGRGVENDGLPAALAVGQEQAAPVPNPRAPTVGAGFPGGGSR
jgi:hypothetical protein